MKMGLKCDIDVNVRLYTNSRPLREGESQKVTFSEKYHITHQLVRFDSVLICKVRKVTKIRNRYKQVPHLTQDTTCKPNLHPYTHY